MRVRLMTLGLAGAALATALLAAPSISADTASGVYTDEQAAAGATLYAAHCAMCHGPTLEGTWEIPALKGHFIANWSGSPVSELYGYVSRAMPQNAPGSLSAQDNARIVAYLLRENGMPAGTSALPADGEALKAIAFKPAGPAK